MALKSGQGGEADKVDVEELLDYVDKTLDRVKTLYEQYFLGIQKQPPAHLHGDVERRLRDLTQMQIRNTGLRYRFATLQQKFGSYNSYWRRTLRQIENGTYARNLAKLGRRAAMTGEEIPEEILAAMPKRMREQVKRDREAALAIARRRDQTVDDGALLDDDQPAMIGEAPAIRDQLTRGGAHVLADDGDFDIDAFFASVTDEDENTTSSPPPKPTPAAPPRQAPEQRFPRADTDIDRGEFADDTQDGVPAFVERPTPTTPVIPTSRQTGPIPVIVSETGAIPTTPASRQSGPIPTQTGAIPTVPASRQSGPIPTVPASRQSGPIPTARPPAPPPLPPRTQPLPRVATNPGATGMVPPSASGIPAPASGSMPGSYGPGDSGAMGRTQPMPRAGTVPGTGPVPAVARPGNAPAPSQVTRPLPITPGASQHRPATPVESMNGPFPRAPTSSPPAGTTQAIPRPAAPPAGTTQAIPRPAPPPVSPRQEPPRVAPPKPAAAAPMRPPPGMNDADVNALYAKYVQAKKTVGEEAGPGAYGKLLATINAQAPKIMEQYKAKGVEFSVVVKDNQVVIKAKPK